MTQERLPTPEHPQKEQRGIVLPEEPPAPLTHDLATRRELTPKDIERLVAWANERGLNAYDGHVVLYHGQPFITLAGRLAKAWKETSFSGWTWRVLSRAQREDAGYNPADFVVEATVHLKPDIKPIVELGAVTRHEQRVSERHIVENVLASLRFRRDCVDLSKGSYQEMIREAKDFTNQQKEQLWCEVERRLYQLPLHRDPLTMARKRALAKALERAFPIQAMAIEEVANE